MKNRKNRIQRYKSDGSLPADFIKESGLNVSQPDSFEEYSDLIFYDTFDWRLNKNSLILIRNKNSVYLYNLKKGQKTLSLQWNIKKFPAFYKDFPESELKNKLSAYLGIRALIPLITIAENKTTYQIKNDDEKTVAQLVFQTVENKKPSSNQCRQITLESIRGYPKEFSFIDKFLQKKGLIKSSIVPYFETMVSSGIQPGSYSSKFKLKLDPETTSAIALRKILIHLIKIIKINEDGIRKDTDIEFLHDFRVAGRRARSAISQIKYALPNDITLKLKNDLTIIGKMTNRLRDLDVYLLKRDEYINILPEKLQKGMEPVFIKLEKERIIEHKKLKTFLSGKKYKNILSNAEKYIEKDYASNIEAKNSNISILPLARKTIWNRYNRIISSGRLINDITPDMNLHELRIECKKLRYLLEFFSSLFPTKKMDIIINQLKKLQDNLGDFNDLSVQQESMREILERYNQKAPELFNVSMSIGGLIAILNNKQQELRHNFTDTFSEFATKKNRKLYKNLFTTNKNI